MLFQRILILFIFLICFIEECVHGLVVDGSCPDIKAAKGNIKFSQSYNIKYALINNSPPMVKTLLHSSDKYDERCYDISIINVNNTIYLTFKCRMFAVTIEEIQLLPVGDKNTHDYKIIYNDDKESNCSEKLQRNVKIVSFNSDYLLLWDCINISPIASYQTAIILAGSAYYLKNINLKIIDKTKMNFKSYFKPKELCGSCDKINDFKNCDSDEIYQDRRWFYLIIICIVVVLLFYIIQILIRKFLNKFLN